MMPWKVWRDKVVPMMWCFRDFLVATVSGVSSPVQIRMSSREFIGTVSVGRVVKFKIKS